MLLFNLKDFLEDLTKEINNVLEKYTQEPAFWVILAILLFLICCWAIKYFNRK